VTARLRLIRGQEWLLVLGTAVGLALLLMVPYALGHWLARPGTVYTGLVMNAEDSQSYFAKMVQGFDGHWQYRIPFTSEDHEPALIGTFYLLLGHVARWSGISLTAVWHLARFLAGVFLCLTTFGFIGSFLARRHERWTAYLLAILGSGFGWLLFVFGQTNWLGAFPVDFKMPEAHLFFSALTFSHVALGTALLQISLWLLLAMTEPNGRPWLLALAAGLAMLGLGAVYPFLLYLVLAVAGLYWLFISLMARRPQWLTAAYYGLAFAIPAPLYVYYAYTLRVNEVFRAWDGQAATLSPPWPHYLVAFGPLLLFAGLIWFKRNEPGVRSRHALLWLWILAAALLVYTPLNPQRRFVQGVQVPLSILATAGFWWVLLPAIGRMRWFQKLTARPRYSRVGMYRYLTVLWLAVMSLSNWYVLADITATAAIRQPFPFFRSQAEFDMVNWLRENSSREEVILGAYATGNLVAARAGNYSFTGHWAETVDWLQKEADLQQFFAASTGDDWRHALLEEYGIRYLWVGPHEKALGEFDPSAAAYLRPIHREEEIILYEVLGP
jgi:hypothetical protein